MRRTLLTNATLIDVDDGARPSAHVMLAGERIESITFGQPPVAEEATLVDLRGRCLMPGMFNCHYHASYAGIGSLGGSPSVPVGMEAPPALQAMRAAHHVGLALDAGFTSLVSAGATYAIDASLKLAIAEGTLRGPRITAGSRDVSTTGHSLDNYYPWHWPEGAPPSINRCDGADGFRRGIREEIKRGAEIIKIFLTSGHGVTGAPNEMELLPEELQAAIETAHHRGVKLRAHIATRAAILTAVRLGMDVIDHGDGLDGECIDRILERNVFLVPSLLYPSRVADTRPGPVADRIRADMERMFEMLSLANTSGVKLLLGDDFGTAHLVHGTYADELDFYVNVAGIPARDVLRWATRHGAELVGMAGQLGELRPGAIADLIVIDGNPLADVRILKDAGNILAVLKAGVFQKNLLNRLDDANSGILP